MASHRSSVGSTHHLVGQHRRCMCLDHCLFVPPPGLSLQSSPEGQWRIFGLSRFTHRLTGLASQQVQQSHTQNTEGHPDTEPSVCSPYPSLSMFLLSIPQRVLLTLETMWDWVHKMDLLVTKILVSDVFIFCSELKLRALYASVHIFHRAMKASSQSRDTIR